CLPRRPLLADLPCYSACLVLQFRTIFSPFRYRLCSLAIWQNLISVSIPTVLSGNLAKTYLRFNTVCVVWHFGKNLSPFQYRLCCLAIWPKLISVSIPSVLSGVLAKTNLRLSTFCVEIA